MYLYITQRTTKNICTGKSSLWFSKETNSIRLISEIATYMAVEKAFKLFLSLMENRRQLKVFNADVIHRDGLLRHNDKKTYSQTYSHNIDVLISYN